MLAYVYTPKGGTANSRRVLINLHGGGFSGCWPACAELESIPIASLVAPLRADHDWWVRLAVREVYAGQQPGARLQGGAPAQVLCRSKGRED